MTRRLPIAVAVCVALAGLAVAGCGKSSNDNGKTPVIGKKGGDPSAARSLGFPAFATKNTTRVGGGDPVADAAGVARAVFSGTSSTTRPTAVTLVDQGDWQGALAAAVFMSPPVRAPILLSHGTDLPGASADALSALDPTGSKPIDGAQVIRVGNTAKPGGYKTTSVGGSNPYAQAAAVDSSSPGPSDTPSDRVVIASGEKPDFAMPAAGWAAKAGDPVLYAKRDEIPKETVTALRSHDQPKIYVLGPSDVISDKVLGQLRKLGTVTRIAGKDAIANAIAFSRFIDGRFGWGVVDPGHGLVFVNSGRPADAAAAAPLSATGTYGPHPARQGRASHRARAVPARHPARLRARPRARGLQPRLDHRRRGGRLGRGPVAARLAARNRARERRPALQPQVMSEAEDPARLAEGRTVTVEDVRALMGASTPHFALQLRNRIAKLIAPLPAGDPARLEGEREIDRLTKLGYSGETRIDNDEADDLDPLPSLTDQR